MILFVTGQFAAAQYVHPLLQHWEGKTSDVWQLVAIGSSCKYWNDCQIPYTYFEDQSPTAVASYLELHKPSLVVVSASATEELEYIFVLEAKSKGIESACFIDMWTNYRARFQYNGKAIFPDHVLAIDDRCADEMVAKGIPGKIICIIGQPYLEKVITNTPPLGDNLLIVSQPIRKYRGKSLGYDETDFKMVCLKAVEKLAIYNVYVTRHPDEVEPENKTNRSSGIIGGSGQGLLDVAHCHTVLGMYSMQMIIGYLWGRKVASVQPGLCAEDPSPLSRWGLIPRLKQVEDLVEFIQKDDEVKGQEIIKDSLVGSLNRFEAFCRMD